MKRIYITESQLARFLLTYDLVLTEDINMNMLKNKIKTLLKRGIGVSVIVGALIHSYNMGYDAALGAVHAAKEEIEEVIETKTEKWELIADDVHATVYNAIPQQCNNDITHTASMFRLNLNDVLSHRIIAMERTMMAEFGLKYGDVVKIEGTGRWDGEWQIQDTMNKRFAGQHKIDILVPGNVKSGKWENVKIYKLNNPEEKDEVKSQMAPQLSKKQALAQIEKMKKDMA